MPETLSKQSKISSDELRAAVASLPTNVSADELITAIRQQAEDTNRAAQAELATPPAMESADWQARREWLLDGQPIYGELQTFLWPAVAALLADDQVEYSRQRDLLFKALRTFLGDPPPNPTPPVVELPTTGPITPEVLP